MTQSGSWSRRGSKSEPDSGLPADALEAARAAAAREGVPLERWLENTILARTAGSGEDAPARRPVVEDRAPPPYGGDSRRAAPRREPDRASRGAEDLSAALGEVSRRLNALLGEVGTTPARSPARLHDTVAQLGNRLDALTADARASQDSPRPDPGRRPALDAAVAEINARQRLLDSEPMVPAPAPAAPPPRASRLEADSILNLRCDIADLARAIGDLAPRRAVEALGVSMRALETRLEETAPPPIDIAQLNELTRMLVEVRESVRDMQGDDGFVALSNDVRGLHKRFDALDQIRLEPALLQHLAGQIADLRAQLGQAQPAPAIDDLARELSQLAAKVDRIGGVLDDAAATADIVAALERKLDKLTEIIVANAGSEGLDRVDAEALADIRDRLDRLHEALETSARYAPEAIERKLDQLADAIAANAAAANDRDDDDTLADIRDRLDRLQAALDNTARNAPMAIERSMLLLVDKLDRIQAQVADGGSLQPDLGELGARLDRIVERLDQPDGRSGQLESIERALNDLFAQLEETRFSAIDAARAAARAAGAGPVEDLIRDLTDLREAQRSTELKTHDTLESVHGTLERVVDRLAMLEEDLARRGDLAADEPDEPALQSPPPALPAAALPLPPLSPLAPPPAAPAVPAPAAEQEPELPPDHPLEPGSRTPILRAGAPVPPPGRTPAPAAAPVPPPAPEPSTKASFIAAARRAAQQATADTAAPPAASGEAAPGGLRGAIARHRTLILALLLLVALAATAPLVLPGLLSSAPKAPAVQPAAPAPVMEPAEPAEPPSPPAAPGPQSRLPSGQIISQLPSAGLLTPDSAAGAFSAAAIQDAGADTTGSVRPQGAAPAKAAGELPVAIGSLALRDAALSGDPAAMFEVATRFADGRGVSQNYPEAARWYERAALQGLMPAAYRMGSLYEKGQGVPRDVQMARRYYALAAEAGNVKAMHNLAVLYAEGIDGKPDYRQASQLFRKAADRGLRDSQYNLAILYARGLGVDLNLGESFKWFALAANQGDADAQKKRDDVTARLDAQTLLAARLAVQTWVAQPLDAAANDVRPSADWDRADGARSRKATGRS